MQQKSIISTTNIKITELRECEYNPRKWSEEKRKQLRASIEKFGIVDPVLANSSKERKNIIIGGNFRVSVLKELKYKEVPVVYLDIPNLEDEKELNLRLNLNQGEWDYKLLAEFDESILSDVGFDSLELDNIYEPSLDNPEEFNIEKELDKLKIENIGVRKGDVWVLGEHKLACGDSTEAAIYDKLLPDEQIDMTLTDPPYILDYLHGKKRDGKPAEGFGLKRNRRYIETEELPDNFTELWMDCVAAHSKNNSSIIVFENWKNLRVIWNEMEKHFKVRNMITWHIPNRHQNFGGHAKFFNKHDIAMVGGRGDVPYNTDKEAQPLQEEYETALFAIKGKPHWEKYKKGKLMPTDFIEHVADDASQSGQSIIFGTKPLPVLIPYMKILTKRGDIVFEPFGGSGSCLIAAEKLKRKCRLIEKVPIYAQVIIKRWENETGLKAKLLIRDEDSVPYKVPTS